MAPRAMLMQHDEDPRELIFKNVGLKNGVIPGFSLFGNRVLIGIYERPSKMKAIKTVAGDMVTLELPDGTRKEDEHQGKAGLVLAMGHSAFKSDHIYSFGPDNLKIGDWVMMFVSHGLKCVVNGQLCRLVRDQDITMKIPAPDQVY